MSEEKHRPHLRLGKKIKYYREEAKESIAEVSGAVEIDTHTLIEIECGKVLPSEDILLLLISHFEIEDDAAVSLWELAGYDKQRDKAKVLDQSTNQQVFMVVPTDNRILYSDKTDIAVNDAGVVLSFQQSGNSSQPIARVGMSKQQAEATLDLLQRALHPQPKLLQSPKQKTTTDEKSIR